MTNLQNIYYLVFTLIHREGFRPQVDQIKLIYDIVLVGTKSPFCETITYDLVTLLSHVIDPEN